MIREHDESYFLERKFILSDILRHLFEWLGSISDDSVAYKTVKCDFGVEDFNETWNYLQSFDKRENLSSGITEDNPFPQERSYFEIDNIKFMINVMSGQGSIFSFVLDGEFEDYKFQDEYKIELSMDFLELEFPNWIQKKIVEHNRLKEAMEEAFNSPEWKKGFEDWKNKHGK